MIMRKITLFTFLFLFFGASQAQDTFSIVAIDTITGEIGGAGASCIDESAIPGGVLIINDIIPGRGAIHTQSYWNVTNQTNAHNRMMEGMSPQEIIDWLVAHDSQNNPGVRQYGIVDFDPFVGNPRSAGFTGANCMNYKNHITGRNYSIQGNILLGQQILDSMESCFLNTEGSLAEKLMAALQGAKVPGADTRCLPEGVSSLSAFIRVAKTNDPIGNFYCDLLVPSRPYGVDPIDSLQVLFDQWLIWSGVHDENFKQPLLVSFYPNPASDYSTIQISGQKPGANLTIEILDMNGKSLIQKTYSDEPVLLKTADYVPGMYFYRVYDESKMLSSGKFNIIRN
jgi:uncharacterized Ntn-hydrolase superfamily protein